jgi:predicted RNA-binding protein associated with RNAse of E/G family
MHDEFKPVTIHLSRIGKPERSYQEGLVEDDGIRLKTFSLVPESVGLHLSEKFCKQGWLLPGQVIHSVSKYHFYQEFFSIVVYQEEAKSVLGYYCDIVTPLQRKGNEYYLTDLILDLWVFPDARVIELDRDEFENAAVHGLFPSGFENDALATLRRLQSEIEQGIFPRQYMS